MQWTTRNAIAISHLNFLLLIYIRVLSKFLEHKATFRLKLLRNSIHFKYRDRAAVKLNIQVLGSTSSGNCTVIWNEKDAILIDCGFSQKYICQNLKLINLDFARLCGALITHTHTDHVHRNILNRLILEKVPIFCHSNIGKDLDKKYPVIKTARHLNLMKTFKKEMFSLGSFNAQAFEVPHDSTGGCFGFNIFSTSDSKETKITIATDLGYPTSDLLPYFINSDVIIIEANHDLDMLENSSRPYWLKKRIAQRGHLSNGQCADLLEKVINRSTKLPEAIILAHISQECNTNNNAVSCIQNMLRKNNCDTIRIIETYQMKANNTVSV